MILIDTIVEDPDTTQMSVRLPTKEKKTHLKGEVEEKILRALDGKYDTVCTLIQMMPNNKDLRPTKVIGRIVAHEMPLKDKEEQFFQ